MSGTGVTAPPAVQERLLDLQGVDDELRRIAGHRTRLLGGQELAAAEADSAAARRAAAEASGALDDLRTRIGRFETDVRLVEQRLERDRTRLAASTSARDAQGLEQEIASLLRRRGALEDDELELMEQAEAAEARAGETAAAVASAAERVERLRADREDALAGLAVQEADARSRRTAVAGDLPADLLALYDRQRTRYGVGAARLVGAVSQGSNMALTGADLAAVRAAPPDAVVLDPESNCILVRTGG